MKVLFFALMISSPALAQPYCGEILTASTMLTEDMYCPTSVYPLQIQGDNITLDGNGFKIVAPQAGAGVLIEGANNTVLNLSVNDVANGDGVLAYQAPGIRIVGGDFSNNLQGVVIYADRSAVHGGDISFNTIRNCSMFGIRIGSDLRGAVDGVMVYNNDLSGSATLGVDQR